MHSNRSLLILVFVFASAATVLADSSAVELRFEPEEFGHEDRIELVVEYADDSPDLDPAVHMLDNLELIGGPSRRMTTTISNGVMTRRAEKRWLVSPAVPGPVTAAVRLGDDDTRRIESIAGHGRLAPPTPTPRPNRVTRRAARILRLEVETSTNRLAVGEELIVTVLLDSNRRLSSLQWIEQPGFDGWHMRPLSEAERAASPAGCAGEGERYLAGEGLEKVVRTCLRQVALRAETEGVATVASGVLQVQVEGTGSLFDDLDERPVKLEIEPLAVEVVARP